MEADKREKEANLAKINTEKREKESNLFTWDAIKRKQQASEAEWRPRGERTNTERQRRWLQEERRRENEARWSNFKAGENVKASVANKDDKKRKRETTCVLTFILCMLLTLFGLNWTVMFLYQ